MPERICLTGIKKFSKPFKGEDEIELATGENQGADLGAARGEITPSFNSPQLH
jgi:hypothetical protein